MHYLVLGALFVAFVGTAIIFLCTTEPDGVAVVFFCACIILAFASGVSLLFFAVDQTKVVTSESTEVLPSQQLAQLSSLQENTYYLKQVGDTFEFSFLDESYDEAPTEIDINNCSLHCGETQDASVIIKKTTTISHQQWAFVKDSDTEEIIYECDFYLPSRENVFYSYEQ